MVLGWVAWATAGGCTNDDEAPSDGAATAAGEGGERNNAGGAQATAPVGGDAGGVVGSGASAALAGGQAGASSAAVAGSSAGGALSEDGGFSNGGEGGLPALTPGQCLTNGQCAAHELCDGGRIEPTCVAKHDGGICTVFEYKDAAGHCLKRPGFCEPCLPDGGCAFADYGPGLYCNAFKRCVGPLKPFEQCQRDSQCPYPGEPSWRYGCVTDASGSHCGPKSNDCEEQGCPYGGYCTGNPDQPPLGCSPWSAEGQLCYSDDRLCEPGTHCVVPDQTSYGTCEASPGEGEPCAQDTCLYRGCEQQRCALGLECNLGTCVDPRPICGSHGRCPTDEVCVMGHVVGQCESDGTPSAGAGGDAAGGAAACSP